MLNSTKPILIALDCDYYHHETILHMYKRMLCNLCVIIFLMQDAAAKGIAVDSDDVEIKWTVLKKQPTQYDGECIEGR